MPLAFITSHAGVAVARGVTLVARLGRESISTAVTMRSPAYFGSARMAASGSMNSVLYRPISVGPSSPLEASAEQSRPGRS